MTDGSANRRSSKPATAHGRSRYSYCAITPVRNEVRNLERLAAAMEAQSLLPSVWVIVDDGSDDGTVDLARALAQRRAWIRVTTVPGELKATRGAPIVRAFQAGLASVDEMPAVIVKLDADVSFERDYFDELVRRFEEDPTLGIASGLCYEWDRGEWRPRFATRSQVRGATRAYRRECLEAVSPLEERMGWDSIDQLSALAQGWRTATFPDLAFRHYRFPGQRDGALRGWKAQGEVAHYLGYRPSYLVVRTIFRAVTDPAAGMMAVGYASAALRRSRRHPDAELRQLLRRQQSLSQLRDRVREALGREGSR